MGKTSIEWTDHSTNPIRARDKQTGAVGHYCEKISSGCAHCYASNLQKRFRMPPFPGKGRLAAMPLLDERGCVSVNERIELFFDDSKLQEVLRRRKPTKWFWADMTDMFGSWVPDEWIDRCFATMALTPHHTHQVLTKRPERMREYVDRLGSNFPRLERAARSLGYTLKWSEIPLVGWPLNAVWLGVSVENQEQADKRIPYLLQTPAAVRFISAEPLLGPIDLGLRMATCNCCERRPGRWVKLTRAVRSDLAFLGPQHAMTALPGIYRAHSNPHGALSVMTDKGLLGIKPDEFEYLPGLDLVIAGGESGHGARPCKVEWIRSLIDQCSVADTACFMKQLGALPFSTVKPNDWPDGVACSKEYHRDYGDSWLFQLKDSKGGDPSEWPQDLNVRQMPEVHAHA